MSHSIAELRKHLFETIDALKDEKKPMDIERAKTISEVAQTIINSAKVEVDYMRLRGDKGSSFVPEEKQVPGTPDRPRLIRGRAMSGSE
jgi:hypothetical protein